jgi:hypothetical protein
METDQARQMKQLQEENSRLEQLVADLTWVNDAAGGSAKKF